MLRTMMKSKIHRATVTQADLHYVGSVTVDPGLGSWIFTRRSAVSLPGEPEHAATRSIASSASAITMPIGPLRCVASARAG